MPWKHFFLPLLVCKLSKSKIFKSRPLLQSFEEAVVAHHAAISFAWWPSRWSDGALRRILHRLDDSKHWLQDERTSWATQATKYFSVVGNETKWKHFFLILTSETSTDLIMFAPHLSPKQFPWIGHVFWSLTKCIRSLKLLDDSVAMFIHALSFKNACQCWRKHNPNEAFTECHRKTKLISQVFEVFLRMYQNA